MTLIWLSFFRKLLRSIALYRYLSSGEPLDATVLRITSNTPLLALVSRAEDGWCTTELKLFFDNAFKIAGIPEGHGDEEQDPAPVVAPPPLAPLPKPKINTLKELKLKLPSTRRKVEVL